jgi:hypothetical protein
MLITICQYIPENIKQNKNYLRPRPYNVNKSTTIRYVHPRPRPCLVPWFIRITLINPRPYVIYIHGRVRVLYHGLFVKFIVPRFWRKAHDTRYVGVCDGRARHVKTFMSGVNEKNCSNEIKFFSLMLMERKHTVPVQDYYEIRTNMT